MREEYKDIAQTCRDKNEEDQMHSWELQIAMDAKGNKKSFYK